MIPHFPFTNQPFKREMGLKILDLKDWIEIDGEYFDQIELKKKLLKENRAEVFIAPPESEEWAEELRDLLLEHLKAHFPSMEFKPDSSLRPLEQIALWVQEDVCLIGPGTNRLVAATVCFPSRWRLADKIGKDSAGIHEPVAGFQPIARPTAQVIEQIPKPMWRMNWSIHDSDQLFSPPGIHSPKTIEAAEILDQTFLRVERQTLRKLPRTGAGVFTIRTYIHRMREVIADPERHRLMKMTLDTLPEDVADYKGMRGFWRTLREAL